MDYEELLYPTFHEIRDLQDEYFGLCETPLYSEDEGKKLYDSQKNKDIRGEGKYKNDLQEGIWTEWYECKYRDEEDLNTLKNKSLFAHVNKLIDEDPEYIKEEEEEWEADSDYEFTSDDFLNYILIESRLREFHGCLKLVSNYVSGNKEGESIGYGKNDEIIFKRHYKDDKFDGPFTEWHENGQIILECNYKNGQLDGHLTRWWDDGERMLDCDYKDGILDGDEILHNKGRMRTWS